MASNQPNRVHGAIACLQRLAGLLAERRAQIARSVGLTEQQWAVVEEISTEHFMPSLFAKQRESSAAAVSKILRQLLAKGLVSVQLGEEDGRQRRYELTVKGRRCIEDMRREREAAIRKVWNGFSDDELDRFADFSTRLAERLDAYARRWKEHSQGASLAREDQRAFPGGPLRGRLKEPSQGSLSDDERS